MPFASVTSERVQFENSLTPEDINLLASDPKLRVLQCSSPVEPQTWDLLNDLFLSRRPDVELRVYGFYSSQCNLSFLSRLKRVRHFSADCLMQAVGIEHLNALPKLESLAIGIYDLESFEFLGSVPKELKKLSLEGTRSKRPRLDLLNRFKSLTTLYLEGQQKGIEVLAELRNLEDLTLRSISMSNLNPIMHHERLRSLGIKLGGITDLSAIEGNNSIKYLELWMIKGLTDVSVIATLRALQFVFLQTLKNIKALPNLSKLTRLRRIFLDTMTGLEDVSALRSSPSLEGIHSPFS